MTEAARTVPFFRYPHVFSEYEQAFRREFESVCSRGAFINQQELRDFEASLAAYTGAKYAIGVGNATDALIIACRAAEIGPGAEVIVASHTMVATAASVHFTGNIPVLVDCGRDHMIDPDSVEAAVTDKTAAIMPTQLNGRTANMDRLFAIADKYGLKIIEDAAQGLGSKFKGKQAGTFGCAGVISFYPAKTLGCLGDGGAILTSDDEVFHRAYCLHDHGRNPEGEIEGFGMNSRLDNLQAAFLNAKLPDYDRIVQVRRRIASQYGRELSSIKELQLPPAPDSEPDHFDVFQNYELEAESRDALVVYLKERGVGTLVQWGGKAVHQHEALGFKVSLPYTERMFRRCVMLPMNTSLTEDEVSYVCTQIRSFYSR